MPVVPRRPTGNDRSHRKMPLNAPHIASETARNSHIGRRRQLGGARWPSPVSLV